mmetsp:Transcript_4192/g.5833  ORF Transcript_4192/g.5833 Transcript_4192/m.5833 type:complete len:204 (-) Transcript_4192:1142-1753(-)
MVPIIIGGRNLEGVTGIERVKKIPQGLLGVGLSSSDWPSLSTLLLLEVEVADDDIEVLVTEIFEEVESCALPNTLEHKNDSCRQVIRTCASTSNACINLSGFAGVSLNAEVETFDSPFFALPGSSPSMPSSSVSILFSWLVDAGSVSSLLYPLCPSSTSLSLSSSPIDPIILDDAGFITIRCALLILIFFSDRGAWNILLDAS